MNFKKRSVLATLLLFFALCAKEDLFAQKKAQPAGDKEEIVITEHPADKNAIFKLNDTIKYGIDLKNAYHSQQDGQISYAITDFNNKLIVKKSMPVSLPAHSFKQVQISMPGQKSGFYKVNFMLNVTDDDDTVKRVFGVDTTSMTSPYKTPDDFWQFWDDAKNELAQVDPKFKVTFMPNLSKGNDEIYLIEMQSLGNLTVRAWMTLPKDRKPGEKLPVSIGFPGYGGEMKPVYGVSGMANIGLNIRGLGNSRDVIHPTRDDYINVGIEDKNTYIFKGVMMDCVRLIDFVCSRPDLDSKAIFTSGGSLGGYLSMVTASLDDRVTICSGDNPGYPDIRALGFNVFPINTMKYYSEQKHFDIERSLKVWDYYNLKSFVTRLKCPVVMGIGLLDNFIAPITEMYAYNNIPLPNKKLFIFPTLAHEVGPEQGMYVGAWVYSKLHVYDKWIVYHKPEAAPVAQAPVVDPNAEVIDLTEHPRNKNAIFTSDKPVSYTINLNSTFKHTESGKLSYAVTTPNGKIVAQNSVAVSIEPKGAKTVAFEIPAQSAGIYNVNFMINTSGYDDTTRRAFGVDTNKIVSTSKKPADFDAFWDNAKKELARVAPNFKVTEKPDLEHGNDKVYLIEMQSLGNMTIRGYMSLPKDIKTAQRLPVSMYLPGYGAQAQPMPGTPAMALISLSVRGQPLSDDVLKPSREEYITTGIEDKNKYILKGVLMDCKRLVDFITSRPELDSTAIYASGASMGGYLALALAAIDKRVTIVGANNPVFSDFRTLATVSNSFPMTEIKGYANDKSVKLDALLNTLDYFDLQNFASNIKVGTVVGIGLLDKLAPPTNELTMFNEISGNKKLFIFPNLTHSIGPEIGVYVGKWVYEKLNIWNRYLQFNKENLAAKAKEETSGSESVVIIDHPANKEAVFKANSTINYNVELKNNFFKKQSGKFSYFVYTSEDQFIRKDSVSVSLDSRETKHINIEVPPQKTGFYKINFAIDVDDYDDTLKRVFGVNIEAIRSTDPKPADFDQFWANTRKELAAIPPNFKMTEKPERETNGEQIYLIEMQSLGNITVRAWLSLPKDRRAKEKFPVIVHLPGYGNEMVPDHGVSQFATLAINVRGLGNSRDVIHPQREEYISYDLEDKNKFIYRGAIMDAVRAMDFLYAHPEMFDTQSIFVTGGSQGGYLTLALASVDHRVSICAADNPGYIDLKMPYYNDKWPITVFRDYADQKSVKFETLMDNFEYFNLKNFVSNIQCKVVVGIGLLDPLVPPTNELIMYNNIKTEKKLFIYPNLTHEVAPELGVYNTRWMMDNLGL